MRWWQQRLVLCFAESQPEDLRRKRSAMQHFADNEPVPGTGSLSVFCGRWLGQPRNLWV